MSHRRQAPQRPRTILSSHPQPPLHLRIEKPIYGGAGLARDDRKAIFIPYTLPGELVTATVTHSKSSFAEAALETVLEPSADRATPPCPYFGICGGCHYQHASYPAQLAIKAAILEETLTRARLSPLPPIVTHAAQPFGYRNRIRLHLDPSAETPQATLGYRMRNSHRLVAVDQCPIAAPELEHAIRALAEVCAEQACGRYFSQVELSVNHDGSELLLALWPRSAANVDDAGARLARLCDALQPQLPALRGACVHALLENTAPFSPNSKAPRHNPPQSSRTSQAPGRLLDEPDPDSALRAPLATWSVPQMTYKVGSLEYRVSLGAFFQVNRPLLAQLVTLATAGRTGALAWDLYAGVGLFSRVLAQRVDRVVAVEGAPISFEDLRFHLAGPHQAIRSSTLDFLRREAGRRSLGNSPRATPDFVLVDPPRAGLGDDVTRLLAQIGPPHITYVSCDPATLSRDLRALVDSGYKLQQLHLVDLFPQTFHLETVAMLSRS